MPSRPRPGEVRPEPAGTGRRRQVLWRIVLLVLGAAVLYGLLPHLLDLWGQVPALGSVGVVALVAIVVLQAASWWCSAELDRAVLPQASRFLALTAALAANAIRVVPAAGTALGVRLSYEMWSSAGVDAGAAAGAAAATTIVSIATTAVVPIITLGFALLGAAVPAGLASVAFGGAGLFVALFGAGALLIGTDRPLRGPTRFVERAARRLGARVTAAGIERQRDQLREVLAARWPRALGASAASLTFDYLSLVAALVALDAKPHLSLVLLAFAGAKLLSAVPITPGGLGIVEAGLTGTLVLAGIPAHDALLATLAYRLASYWLMLPVGLAAWLAYRRRYGPIPSSNIDSISSE